MNRQGSTLLMKKLLSIKPFRSFSYHRRAASYWPYRLFLKLRTTSCRTPSLLKSLGSSMKTVSPLEISTWVKAFVKSIFWLCKARIHCKIYINLAVALEYKLRSLGDNLFWIFPLTQYNALSFLIVQSGFLLHLKDYVPGSTLWSANYFLETISHVSLFIRLWISSSIALNYSSKFSPDNTSIYVGVSGLWLWVLRA